MDTAKHPWESLKDTPFCDPSKRMDFVLLFDVKDGNPNGDPDAGNLPRMDPATRHGIVTDVCIKRKIRDYFAMVLGRPIYIQSQDALNTLYFRAAREIAEYEQPAELKATDDAVHTRKTADKAAVAPLYVSLEQDTSESFKKLVLPREETETASGQGTSDVQEGSAFREWLAGIDVEGLEFDPECGILSYLGEAKTKRDFQTLLQQEGSRFEGFQSEIDRLADLLVAAKKGKKGGAKEREAREVVKQKMCELYDDIRLFGAVLTAGTNAGQVRGPMQLTFARSTEEILPFDAAITRCAITKAADWTRKQTEFGRKPWLNYAVYRQHGFYSPLLGERTGVTREDLARFWEALACMFQNSASASKGEMATRDLVVFVHPNHWGKAPSHKLFDRTEVVQPNGASPRLQIKEGGQERIEATQITIHRPLADIWGDL